MRARWIAAFVALVAIALVIGAGCEPEPTGEQVVGEPSELVDETYDVEMPNELVDEEEDMQMAWTITSSAFEDGDMIPAEYTDDGEDVSPPLTFEGVPEDTQEIVLIMHDPDAPREGGWTHWVVYGMAPGIGGLPENVPAEQTVDEPALIQGTNSWDNVGYGGPAPPEGQPHRYQFRGYALSEPLGLDPGASKDEVEAAMGDTIIGEAMLEGLYGRG